MLNLMELVTATQMHQFTNITRKKYYFKNLQQFKSANCISKNLYGTRIQNIFRIRIRLRRYRWTKVLLR